MISISDMDPPTDPCLKPAVVARSVAVGDPRAGPQPGVVHRSMYSHPADHKMMQEVSSDAVQGAVANGMCDCEVGAVHVLYMLVVSCLHR
jgi:hypothetical protein